MNSLKSLPIPSYTYSIDSQHPTMLLSETNLGVTFHQTFSSKTSHSIFAEEVLQRIPCLSLYCLRFPGSSKQSLCTLSKAFICPILIYASPGWFSLLSILLLWRECLRVITGCLSSTPLLPPLRLVLHLPSPINLFFERALKLLPSFPLAFLAHHGPRIRFKKGLWRFFFRSHNLTLNL